MKWIKIDLSVFMHTSPLFHEWDNTLGHLNARIFFTEMVTLIKKVFHSQT